MENFTIYKLLISKEFFFCLEYVKFFEIFEDTYIYMLPGITGLLALQFSHLNCLVFHFEFQEKLEILCDALVNVGQKVSQKTRYISDLMNQIK